MVVKSNLLFRACVPYVNSQGQKKLLLRFLDEKDNPFTFFVDDIEKNSKFKNLKKDEAVTLDLGISKVNKAYILYLK